MSGCLAPIAEAPAVGCGERRSEVRRPACEAHPLFETLELGRGGRALVRAGRRVWQRLRTDRRECRIGVATGLP